jgi:uncharacterized membrane protein
MSRSPLAPNLMIAFAIIGLTVAFYESYSIYNGQLLWCPPPVNGCNEVAASPYARIWGLPVGYYGVVYYLYMLALAALLAYDPLSRGLRIGTVFYAALGVAFSIYFVVLQLGYIRSFCIYCFLSAVTTVLLTLTAVWHLRAPNVVERNTDQRIGIAPLHGQIEVDDDVAGVVGDDEPMMLRRERSGDCRPGSVDSSRTGAR